MRVRTVGVISNGDMGAGIGGVLKQSGLEVITCLTGRSNLSLLRARETNIRDVPSYTHLVQQADLVLSVLIPSEAVRLAEQIAHAMQATGAQPAYADCNAIAPKTVERINKTVTAAGATFIDAGIIGGPPVVGRKTTRIYCSCQDTDALLQMNSYGLDIRHVGATIGQASGLKMVFAASTKGTTALWTDLLIVPRTHLALTRRWPPSLQKAGRRWPGLPAAPFPPCHAVRAGGLGAATFESVGFTPRMPRAQQTSTALFQKHRLLISPPASLTRPWKPLSALWRMRLLHRRATAHNPRPLLEKKWDEASDCLPKGCTCHHKRVL